MKKLFNVALVLACLLPFVALAQDPSGPTVTVLDFLKQVWATLSGIKGASTLAAVAAVVQTIMVFFKTSLADVAGKYKLVLVSLLSLVGAVVAGLLQGETWIQILTNGGVLAAGQVFLHQIVSEFFPNLVA